ncbi:hypothetical protein Btru_040115 [Bulinus truncatus]|nr:hypothetical protein Btru_040115 [Bulinus truncatus]
MISQEIIDWKFVFTIKFYIIIPKADFLKFNVRCCTKLGMKFIRKLNIMVLISLQFLASLPDIGVDDLIVTGDVQHINNCTLYLKSNNNYTFTFCVYVMNESRVEFYQAAAGDNASLTSTTLAARLFLRSGSDSLTLRHHDSCDASQIYRCNSSVTGIDSARRGCPDCTYNESAESVRISKLYYVDTNGTYVGMSVNYINVTQCLACNEEKPFWLKFNRVDKWVFVSLFTMCVILGIIYRQGYFCFKKDDSAVMYRSPTITQATTAETLTSSYIASTSATDTHTTMTSHSDSS